MGFSAVLGPECTLTSNTSFEAEFQAESNADKYYLIFDYLFLMLTISVILTKDIPRPLMLLERPFCSE